MNPTVVALGMLIASLILQDVDNPEYKQWSKFKPGASAKLRSEVETAPGMKFVTETTVSLKSIDATKAVISGVSAMEVAGTKTEKPIPDRDVPAKVKKGPDPDPKAPKPETGQEEIEAAGKKWKCTWTKTVMDSGGTKSTSTVWTCEDVPGQMVKMISEGMMGKTTMILVEVK